MRLRPSVARPPKAIDWINKDAPICKLSTQPNSTEFNRSRTLPDKRLRHFQPMPRSKNISGVMLFCSLLGAVSMLLVSCSSKHYRASADKETAAAIAQKTPFVPNMDTNFTIEATAKADLNGLSTFDKAEEFFGPESDIEKGAQIISLEKALEIAVKHSRSYQNQKEGLYLEALDLTLSRHRFAPLFSGGSKTRTSRDIRGGVDSIVEQDFTGSQGASVSQLTRFGTRLATDFSTDFLRFITGDPRLTSSSAVIGTLSQPLLRGASYQIATENLTQAERDLLYKLREFTRYRKEFSVDIASSYYGVLQNRDAVRNSWRGYQSFKENVAREKAFAEEGQRAQAQLGQLRQAELTTESRWINAIRVYRQSLDQFKIQLGLPIDSKVILDDSELEKLRVAEPNVSLENAIDVALVSRLDLETKRDQLVDSERKIKVSANTFLPQFDAVGRAGVAGNGDSGFSSPNWDGYTWNAGFDLDLPFDRKAERNGFRTAIIRREVAKRELDLAVDTIKLQLNDDWRNLDQAKRNYVISEEGIAIAQSRVEEQVLRQELGRGTARDLVDAQNDLIDSNNQRTSALVSHTVARLKFWRDIGILLITDNGRWEEVAQEVNDE
jgi:outer membrane protein TolC